MHEWRDAIFIIIFLIIFFAPCLVGWVGGVVEYFMIDV